MSETTVAESTRAKLVVWPKYLENFYAKLTPEQLALLIEDPIRYS